MSVCFRLILVASVITMASTCFQCNSKVVKIFEKIRKEVIPIQVQESKLRNRCDKLGKEMASNFFKDYAVKHFTEVHHYNALVDYIQTEAQTLLDSKEKDQHFLDTLATFRNQTTMKLKSALKVYHDKACSPTECGWLKLDVFSCITCKTVKPFCLSRQVCMVDEKRISLEFNEQGEKAKMLSNGLFTAGVSAFILLSAMGLLTLMYWLRKRALLERTIIV
ncbi:izumo sperm-egg fusion protein 2-like isoform X2 [Hyla sarda]|uniref:izumo sperm-egg fusion protein 2-like isoform X2 n=1 Tax=Hyla sarda TaxID=327740 RepID=UPI0024C28C15|nr:izumo sperm-egg fusion protein 2-like isoform X2 [Hyla sarda]